MKIFSSSAIAFVAIIAKSATVICAETVSINFCECSPEQFKFMFDFSLTCSPLTVTAGDAVSNIFYFIAPVEYSKVNDTVPPVAVQSVNVREFNKIFDIILEDTIHGNFTDDNTFQYTSVTADKSQGTDKMDIPVYITLSITGTNQFRDDIASFFYIYYTNNCNAYPVLSKGQSVRWTHFTALTPLDSSFCPLAGTNDPTPVPTLKPSDIPSSNLTPYPLVTPLLDPSFQPSTMPSTNPTDVASTNLTHFPTLVPSTTPSAFGCTNHDSCQGDDTYSMCIYDWSNDEPVDKCQSVEKLEEYLSKGNKFIKCSACYGDFNIFRQTDSNCLDRVSCREKRGEYEYPMCIWNKNNQKPRSKCELPSKLNYFAEKGDILLDCSFCDELNLFDGYWEPPTPPPEVDEGTCGWDSMETCGDEEKSEKSSKKSSKKELKSSYPMCIWDDIKGYTKSIC